jgi:hypothetical protein
MVCLCRFQARFPRFDREPSTARSLRATAAGAAGALVPQSLAGRRPVRAKTGRQLRATARSERSVWVRRSPRFLFVLCTLVSYACGEPQAARAPRPKPRPVREVTGNHTAAADCAAGPALLALKAGLSVEACGASSMVGTASLAVAQGREEGAPAESPFIPVGPRFTLLSRDARLWVHYSAERYQVRQGYRPVLVSRVAGELQVKSARFAAGRFTAEVDPSAGAVFRFGLVPATGPVDGQSLRSGAP